MLIYDYDDSDDEDRNGVIVNEYDDDMTMDMLISIEKHCGVGGGA